MAVPVRTLCTYVDQVLIPNMNSGDIVVMDNIAAHRSKFVVQAIKAAGEDVPFTPPIHPEFNPIEKTWGKLKDILRRWNTLTRKAFKEAVAKALELITISDIGSIKRLSMPNCGKNWLILE